jgi:hypothetical protein
MRRGIALPQVAEEVVGGAFDDSARLFHNAAPQEKSSSPQRHRDTEETFSCLSINQSVNLSCRKKVMNSLFSVSL